MRNCRTPSRGLIKVSDAGRVSLPWVSAAPRLGGNVSVVNKETRAQQREGTRNK